MSKINTEPVRLFFLPSTSGVGLSAKDSFPFISALCHASPTEPITVHPPPRLRDNKSFWIENRGKGARILALRSLRPIFRGAMPSPHRVPRFRPVRLLRSAQNIQGIRFTGLRVSRANTFLVYSGRDAGSKPEIGAFAGVRHLVSRTFSSHVLPPNLKYPTHRGWPPLDLRAKGFVIHDITLWGC
jgi:hypothetical protein